MKTYNKEGLLSKISVFEKDKLKCTVVLEHNKKKRTVKLRKFVPQKEKPVETRIFRFNNSGKLRLQYYSGEKTEKNKIVKDIWVESYFYNRKINKLIRIETAYKSSFSISKNKTPYVRTRFYYYYQRLKRIMINGGTFKREMNVEYKERSLSRIEYKLYLLNWKPRRFKLKKDMHFCFEKSIPVRIDDNISRKKITSMEVIKRIVGEEGVTTPLEKLKYSSDFQYLLDIFEKGLVCN